MRPPTESECELNRKFEKCPCCKQTKFLYFCKSWNKGEPWFGWLCNDCIEELKNKQKQEGKQ